MSMCQSSVAIEQQSCYEVHGGAGMNHTRLYFPDEASFHFTDPESTESLVTYLADGLPAGLQTATHASTNRARC